MRILGPIIIIIATAGLAWAQANYTPAPILKRNFVGQTTATYTPGGGPQSIIEHCQAEFPYSTPCTYREYYSSITFPPRDTGLTPWVDGEWKYPVPVSGSYPLGGAGNNCRDWFQVSWIGTVLDPVGQANEDPETRPCEEAHPVACCATIFVPEPAESSGLTMGILGLGMLVRRRSQ